MKFASERVVDHAPYSGTPRQPASFQGTRSFSAALSEPKREAQILGVSAVDRTLAQAKPSKNFARCRDRKTF
jgi:hypothetical protein